jgi:hypothetical protein
MRTCENLKEVLPVTKNQSQHSMENLQSWLYPTYSDQSRQRLLYCALVLECDVPILEALAFQCLFYKPSSNIQFAAEVFDSAHKQLKAVFGPSQTDWTQSACTWPALDGHIRLNMTIRVDYWDATLSILLRTQVHMKCIIFILDKEGVRYLREDKKLHVLKGESMDALLRAEVQEIVKPVIQ